jgi:hypothetical protein
MYLRGDIHGGIADLPGISTARRREHPTLDHQHPMAHTGDVPLDDDVARADLVRRVKRPPQGAGVGDAGHRGDTPALVERFDHHRPAQLLSYRAGLLRIMGHLGARHRHPGVGQRLACLGTVGCRQRRNHRRPGGEGVVQTLGVHTPAQLHAARQYLERDVAWHSGAD